jgi:hypothetical protein
MNFCSCFSGLTSWSEDRPGNENELRLDSCCSLYDIEHELNPGKRGFPDRDKGWIEVTVLSRKAIGTAVLQAMTLLVFFCR